MIRTPASRQPRLVVRWIALSAVFLVGAFLAQGEAADAQQLRYSTEQSVVRLTVPTPVGVSASAVGHRAVAANRCTRSIPPASLAPNLDELLPLAPKLGPPAADAGAAGPEPRRHAGSVRAPPSRFR